MEKKVTVERGNVVLHVKEFDVQRYLDMGFSALDANGNVIKQAVPKDVAVLQKAYTENQQTIEDLKTTIKTLEAEIQTLKEKLGSRPIVEDVPSEESVEAPKKRGRKSSKES